jgi:putative endonuclease
MRPPQDEVATDPAQAIRRCSTVLILKCADGSYYTGTTRSNLEKRVAEHNSATYGGYTAQRRPVTLAFSQWFERITDAIAAERQVKGWSRLKKEALIQGDFARLPELARRRRTGAKNKL